MTKPANGNEPEAIEGELVLSNREANTAEIVRILAMNPKAAPIVAKSTHQLVVPQDPVIYNSYLEARRREMGVIGAGGLAGISIVGGIALTVLTAELLPVFLCFSFGAACAGGMLATATGNSVKPSDFADMLEASAGAFSRALPGGQRNQNNDNDDPEI